MAASVMQVAAFEAAIQAMCFLYPDEVKRTSVHAHKRFRGKRNKALEFSLNELIKVADQAGWFPAKRISWGGKRTTLAGFAHEVRKLRNFVHPGVWAREHHGSTKFSKRAYDVVHEVFDVATSWLLHRIHQSMIKRMKREGLIP
jgi:hypothetical protein